MTSVEGSGGSSRKHEPRAGPGAAEEALRRLEQRLDRASEAAERLFAEAASEAAARLRRDPPEEGAKGGANEGAELRAAGVDESGEPPLAEERLKPPPAGWQMPQSEAQRPGPAADLDVLVQLLRSLRDLIPPELQRRLAAALREVLLALRALIDWYLERLEQQREKPVEVEDIPIL
jgi:hypothetical protein